LKGVKPPKSVVDNIYSINAGRIYPQKG